MREDGLTKNGRLVGNFYWLQALFALWLVLNIVVKFVFIA